MLRISPFWNSLLLLLAPVLLVLPLSPLATDLWAHHLLSSKLEQIQIAQQTRHQDLDQVLREQMGRFAFDCGSGDLALLRDPKFYNNHIRLQGLQLASGEGCSSLGPAIPPAAVGLSATYPSQERGLTATASQFDTEQELVAYFRIGGNTIYWVLNNSWTHDLLKTPCANCFFIEFTPLERGQHTQLFPRGERAIKEEPDSQSLSAVSPSSQLKQTLWAGAALREYAREQVYLYGFWGSVALGVVLVALYWLQRNYRRSLKSLLEAGIERREFTPFYQPIVDSRTLRVVGFEALLRWQRGGDQVSPGAFIDYAEEQGLIMPMTGQLLEQVIKDLCVLGAEQWVSVNLVAAHIEQPRLRELLQRHHWPSPLRLTFELTERNPITDIEGAAREITALQQRGYHFKLDDFGTGYGGFAYLQQLGIRQIKIDKMFVDTIGTNDLKRSVLDAIIAFGRESDMEMIAEGVETREQVEYLSQQGVYLIQGYVYGKPMSLAQLLKWQTLWQ